LSAAWSRCLDKSDATAALLWANLEVVGRLQKANARSVLVGRREFEQLVTSGQRNRAEVNRRNFFYWLRFSWCLGPLSSTKRKLGRLAKQNVGFDETGVSSRPFDENTKS
jgi:hypothetical protein